MNKYEIKYHKAYKVLRGLSSEKLNILIDLAGLDKKHYNTKSLMAKGIIVSLSDGFPPDMKNWS